MSRAELMQMAGASGHRMRRRLSPVPLFLLLLFCCACGAAYVGGASQPESSVELFAAGRTKVPANVGDAVPGKDVRSFNSLFLAGGSGVMVAFAEAQYTESDDNAVDVVARYIGTEGENWADNTTKQNGDNWRTQLVLQRKDGGHSAMRNPLAVIKGNKIYLLALNNTRPDGSVGDPWHLTLSVGEVMRGGAHPTIQWERSESLSSKLTEKVNKQGLSVLPAGGRSALLTRKGRIVFGLRATSKKDGEGFAILQLKEGEHWDVSFVKEPGTSCSLYLFEEAQKLITVFVRCHETNRYVKEHEATAEGWKDAEAMPLGPRMDSEEMQDFTTVSFGSKTVVLFTEGRYKPLSRGFRWEFRLWVTDGSRTHDAGVIAAPLFDATSEGLLYTNGELFLLYDQRENQERTIFFARAGHLLGNIKSVLETWDEKDAYLSKRCRETAPEGASPDTLCSIPALTAGLVGFLSGKGNATLWHDEYRFVNATVANGAKVDNGYTFRGARSGVVWPVGERYLGYRNNFARYGMTVLATVTVHETPKDDTPLLTVDGFEANERLGLWCEDKQWKVRYDDGKERPAASLETEKTYNVAFILHNNTISVYINGKSQGGPLPIPAATEKHSRIRVFIGSYESGNEINVTVTNVFLYHRVLNDNELKTLGRIISTARPLSPGDSSVHARIGAVLLLLLGLGVLEVLF